jgi:tetratricopeptide (TPR) repeat protein
MAETTKTEAQGSTQPVPIEEKLHVWFEQNRNIVIGVCIVVIVVAAVVIFLRWKEASTETAASQAMARAKTIAEWEQVATLYPTTKVAPGALLLAAESFFDQGRYGDAQATYEKFLQKYPRDAFADSAQYGVAACLEAQAKTKDDFSKAIAAYDSLLSTYKDSFHAGEANLAIARCLEAQGEFAQAYQRLENTIAMMANSQWAREAAARKAVLSRKYKPSAPAPTTIPLTVLPQPAQQPAAAPAQ